MNAAVLDALVTPTGIFVTDAAPHSDEWHAERRAGIGSSDIPAILGLSQYQSAGHVWASKRGELPPDEAGEAAEWGNLLEDVIASKWATDRGFELRRAPIIKHRDHPHHRASIDRLVSGCPLAQGAFCICEVKNRNAFVAGTWREDVPDDVLGQAQWQAWVSGLHHVHVVVLIGGNHLVEHVVLPEPKVIEYLIAEVDRVWQHVLDGIAPPVDSAALLVDLLDRLNPNREGQAEIDAVRVLEIHALYKQALAMEQTAEAAKEEAKAALVQLLGAADTACVEGIPVATYKPTMRTTPDLERLLAEFPDAHAACVAKKATKPGVRWKDKAVAAMTPTTSEEQSA